MDSRKIILVDMDGPLADFEGHIREMYEVEYGEALPHPEAETFSRSTTISEEIKRRTYELMFTPGFSRDIMPEPGAIEAMRELSYKHDVLVLTSPMDIAHNYADKKMWYDHYLPFLPERNLILSSRKDLVYGDYLIDDRKSNVLPWQDRWGNRGFLYSTFWNSHEHKYKWPEILKEIL